MNPLATHPHLPRWRGFNLLEKFTGAHNSPYRERVARRLCETIRGEDPDRLIVADGLAHGNVSVVAGVRRVLQPPQFGRHLARLELDMRERVVARDFAFNSHDIG